MASDERQQFRPKLRFGFSGRAARRTREEAGVDDFLDSMSRRSRLSSEIDQETSVLVGEGAANTEQGLKPHELGLPVSGRIGLAKIVSSLVLVGGMALLWLYGALGTLADPSALDRLARSPEIISVFSDPLKLGLVALVSFIPLFFLRRRHKTESRLLISKLL